MSTTIKTVGIVSPGDMGHAVGQVLRDHGLRVIASLAERSERTKTLAEEKLTPGEHLIVCERGGFAKALAELLANPAMGEALASQARLEYRLEGNSIRVQCAGTAAPPPSPDARPPNVRVRADLREALERSFPGASTDEIDRAIATLEAQLRHD